MRYDYETSPQGIKPDTNGININYLFLFNFIPKLLRKKKSIKILEIGCGGGRNLLAVKQQFKNKINLYGTDISRMAIGYAKNLKIGKFRVSDSKKIPFREKFDLILIIDLLEHLETKNSVSKTLDNACQYLNNSQGYLYICVPIELNSFSFIWFYSHFPFFKNLTQKFYGHTLQFKIDDFVRLINKKHFRIEKIFYSAHLISQFQTLLLYFIPKSLLRLFLGEKTERDLRDASEIVRGRKHPLLNFVKKVIVSLGDTLSWFAFIESSLRKDSSFGAGNLHLLLRKR